MYGTYVVHVWYMYGTCMVHDCVVEWAAPAGGQPSHPAIQ